MKKEIALIIALIVFVLSGCGSNNHQTETIKTDSVYVITDSTKTGDVYQCPMKCEDEKTYNKPGNCPECKMELEKL